MGYDIFYQSPSQGKINVSWDGPMLINNKKIECGPYKRFENIYCYQEFEEIKTEIKYNDLKLTLDFKNVNKY